MSDNVAIVCIAAILCCFFLGFMWMLSFLDFNSRVRVTLADACAEAISKTQQAPEPCVELIKTLGRKND